ncbi:MAG: hypothetical protein FWC53_02525 [Firmicutes bacterium]|nr:hypothetical protein [Bacillota bacterium]
MKYLVFVGVIIYLTGIGFYVKDMLKGQAKPNRVTWFMWSVTPLIATFAAIAAGVTWAVVPTFILGFGALVVFTISLFKKEAYWNISKFDLGCGVLAVLALILWYMTKQPVVAIVFSILSDFSSATPTLIKAWKHPESESSSTYITGVLSTITSFAAIETFNFASAAYPSYVVILNMLIVIGIERRRLFGKKKRSY